MTTDEAYVTEFTEDEAISLNKKARKSLTFGVLSVPLSLFPFISLPFAVVGIYFGKVSQLSMVSSRAKWGVITSWIGLIFSVLSSFVWIPIISEMSGPTAEQLQLSREAYIDNVYNYSIKMPHSWTFEIAGEKEKIVSVIFYSPRLELLGLYTYRPFIALFIRPDIIPGSASLSLSQRLSILEMLRGEFLKNGIPIFGPVKDILIVKEGNKQFLKFSLIIERKGVKAKTMGHFSIDWNTGRMFIIFATAPESRFSKYEKLYEEVFSSFTLTKNNP